MYKFLKTFKAAWYLPEVCGESKKSIRISRTLLVLLPALSIIASIFAGAPVGGVVTSILLSVIASFAFIMTIYMLFKNYIPLVERHLQKEKKKDVELGALVQEFQFYPEITNLPIYETDEGVWVGYGHIDPEAFVEAVVSIVKDLTGDDDLAKSFSKYKNHVEHVYAVLIKHPAIHGEFYFRYAEITAVGAFPVTRLYI